ncbi:hypothetical protein, partial [Mycobacterium intracellulare]|uniref:hypothetical protein n=1 Tax=Mycobacterium intracellulare TaxID=1767 RepID=UPI003D9DF226
MGKIPTTSVRRRISLLSRSFIRPSGAGQPVGVGCSSIEALEVVGKGVGDAVVAGGFVGPAA